MRLPVEDGLPAVAQLVPRRADRDQHLRRAGLAEELDAKEAVLRDDYGLPRAISAGARGAVAPAGLDFQRVACGHGFEAGDGSDGFAGTGATCRADGGRGQQEA